MEDNNDTDTGTETPEESIVVDEILFMSVFVITLASFLYGVISWCLLKKFRHYKNYVYVSTILAFILRFTPSFVLLYNLELIFNVDGTVSNTFLFFNDYFTALPNYWLLVICYIFYGDIVKVFKGDVTRRYLKTSLFAWGVPLLASVISMYILPLILTPEEVTEERNMQIFIYLSIAVFVVPLVVNLFFYIKVVYCLYHITGVTSAARWRRFYILTLILIFSSDSMLHFMVSWQPVWMLPHTVRIIIRILVGLATILIDIFLPIVRGNRLLWRNFLIKTRAQHRKEVNNLSKVSSTISVV